MIRTLGRYELLRPLGRGGMADVYLGRRRAARGVEKRVVVKCIREERASDPRFVQMFVQEARLSMALTHKNIVPVFDFGRVDDEFFLVMEYVRGMDLGVLLAGLRARGQRLESSLAAYIAAEACEALDYAHGLRDEAGGHRGIAHRDVTPRNVLLSTVGEVKLADFGVAAAIAEVEPRSRVRGTPAYMSPEQARGQTVDRRSDLFSLGLVLWEAAAGRRAYRGDDGHALWQLARRGRVPALPEQDEVAIPEELRAIVTRATASDPDARYADARAMQVALDQFLMRQRDSPEAGRPGHRLARLVTDIAGAGADDDESRGRESSSRARAVELQPPGGDDRMGTSTIRSMAATVGDESVVNEALGPETVEPIESSSEERVVDTSARPEVEPSVTRLTAHDREPGPHACDDALAAEGSNPIRRGSGPGHRVAALAALIALALAGFALVWRSTDTDRAAQDPVALTIDETPLRSDGAVTSSGGDGQDASTRDSAIEGAHTAASERPARGSAAEGQTPATTRAGHERPPAPEQPQAPPRTTRAQPHDMRPRPEAPARPLVHGTVKISATPWAAVTLDGHDASCSETPCVLSLPPGRYTLHLVNPVARIRKDVQVSIAADETVLVNTRLLGD